MISRIAQSQHHNVFKHSGSLDERRRNVIRCEPHTLVFKTFFLNSFVDFESCQVVSSCDMRKNEALSFDRASVTSNASITAVAFKRL